MRLIKILASVQLAFALAITNDLVARDWSTALYAGGVTMFYSILRIVEPIVTTLTPQAWAVGVTVTICRTAIAAIGGSSGHDALEYVKHTIGTFLRHDKRSTHIDGFGFSQSGIELGNWNALISSGRDSPDKVQARLQGLDEKVIYNSSLFFTKAYLDAWVEAGLLADNLGLVSIAEFLDTDGGLEKRDDNEVERSGIGVGSDRSLVQLMEVEWHNETVSIGASSDVRDGVDTIKALAEYVNGRGLGKAKRSNHNFVSFTTHRVNRGRVQRIAENMETLPYAMAPHLRPLTSTDGHNVRKPRTLCARLGFGDLHWADIKVAGQVYTNEYGGVDYHCQHHHPTK